MVDSSQECKQAGVQWIIFKALFSVRKPKYILYAVLRPKGKGKTIHFKNPTVVSLGNDMNLLLPNGEP